MPFILYHCFGEGTDISHGVDKVLVVCDVQPRDSQKVIATWVIDPTEKERFLYFQMALDAGQFFVQ